MTTNRFAPYPFIRLSAFVLLSMSVYIVLRPFLHALVWASVISLTAWPLNMYLRRKFPYRSESLAAIIMTILLIVMILGIVIPLSLRLASEVRELTAVLRTSLENGNLALPTSLQRFPLIDEYLLSLSNHGRSLREDIFGILDEYQLNIISFVSFAARGIWGFVFNAGVTIFSSYFFFRYGDIFARQLIAAARRTGGEPYVDHVHTSWITLQAVVFGVVGAAIGQGILAGIGYYVCGVPLALLLAVLTILLGLLPFGPAILYIPIAIFMLLSDAHWYYGAGLAVWGVAVVSTIDNVIRPIFISKGTNLPILLAFFGGLGGIAAFGMVGLFVGPVVLALAYDIWLKYVKLNSSHSARIAT